MTLNAGGAGRRRLGRDADLPSVGGKNSDRDEKDEE
jgi:hypothetical protein